MMQWLKSRRLHFYLGGVALLFCLFALFRLVFALAFSSTNPFQYEPLEQGWQTFFIGLRFDLRLAILAMLPLVALCFLPRFNLLNTRWLRLLARAYLAVGLALLTSLYFLDFGHYDYLGVRLNASVLRFVGDADISTSMLWQSYPVVLITAGWLLIVGVMYAAFHFLERHTLDRPKSGLPRSGWSTTLGWTVLIVLTFMGLLGRTTNINLENPVPLRWSDAFFTGDPELAANGLNPVIFLYDTLWIEAQPYDIARVRQYYPLMAEYLGVDQPNPDTLDFSRQVGKHSPGLRTPDKRPPNVVFVMLESLGASRVSAYGNPLETTPHLDQIARDGWFFERFFVPVTGTAKTVWASVTGIPDVTRSETASRNPLITRHDSLINAFSEHRKLYMIGGSAGWANINAVMRQSIDNLTLFEEGYWKGPNVDVWGISDLQLFREADEILRELPADEPFFAYIQTAGNHRPFTIPEDREQFQELNPPESEVQQWGFRSVAQYNAVRFLDYSIGRFLDMARASGYHDNTVFVFFGDHNNRITQLPHMDPIYDQLWLESNHVPHMIYAPKLLKPRVIESAVSLIDMVPTVAGLLGLEYTNRTLGRDLQTSDTGKERAVPLVLVEGSFPIIGMVSQEFLLKMNFDGSDATLHSMTSPTPRDNIADQHPEKFEYLKDLTRGTYETSRYLLYKNVRK